MKTRLSVLNVNTAKYSPLSIISGNIMENNKQFGFTIFKCSYLKDRYN